MAKIDSSIYLRDRGPNILQSAMSGYKQGLDLKTRSMQNKLIEGQTKLKAAQDMLRGATNQESYDLKRLEADKLGHSTFEGAPSKYSKDWVDNKSLSLMSISDRFAIELKKQSNQIAVAKGDLVPREGGGFMKSPESEARKDRKLDILDRASKAKSQAESGKMSVFKKEARKKSAQQFIKTQGGLEKINTGIGAIDDALSAQSKYSKESIGGTGPVATIGGLTKYFSEETESLNAKLKAVNLKNMTTTFAGMSKAIDSDGERRAWEGTQADIANDDFTNVSILLNQKSILTKDKAEVMAQKNWVNQYGNLDGYVSPIDGKVRAMIAPSGELHLVDKSRVSEAITKGYLGIEDYAKEISGQVELEGDTFKTHQIRWK